MSHRPSYPHIPDNFGALPPELCDHAAARAVILPAGYDGTTSYRTGSRLGPRAIIEASRHMELFDEELGRDLSRIGIHTLPEMEVETSGPEAMVQRVYQACREQLALGKFVLLLGGEHSISSGYCRALLERHPRLSIFHVDAHLDLRDRFEGTRWNHACVLRRMHDLMGPDAARRVVHVGIRNVCEEEYQYIHEQHCNVIYAREIRGGLRPRWIHEAVSALSDEVYVTFDLDGLDPAILPATGTPEPGGLMWEEALAALKAIADAGKRVVGADILELMPLPGEVRSDFLAARLAYKMLGYFLG